MGTASSSKMELANAELLCLTKHTEDIKAVHRFTELAYKESSNTDGFKLVVQNVNGRRAFMNFLDSEQLMDTSQFFQNMEKVRTFDGNALNSESKSLLDSFQKPFILPKMRTEDLINFVAQNIENSSNQPRIAKSSSGLQLDDVQLAQLYESTNELLSMLALSYFPKFLESEAYSKWREEESISAPVFRQTERARRQSLNRIDQSVREEDMESFATRSAEFLNPEAIEKIFGDGTWMTTFVTAAEGLPVCITLADASTDARGFPLLYVNKIFESDTGYSREDIRGTNCRFLQGPRTEQESISRLSHALANQLTVRVSITNYRRNGTMFTNFLAMKPVLDMDGNYVYVVGVQFDVSNPDATAKSMKIADSLFTLLPDKVPTKGLLL